VAFVAIGVGSLYLRSPDFPGEQAFRVALMKYAVEEDRYFALLKERPLQGGDKEVAQRVQSELLPYWERMSAAMDASPPLADNSRMHDLQVAFKRYVRTRTDGFRKLVESQTQHNPRAEQEAAALFSEGDRLLPQLKLLQGEASVP
jgi:hypothetical protein